MNKITYETSEEPVVISKATTDIILKQDKPSDMMALYWFYYQTAKWQNTNQAKATNSYVSEGLGWSKDKVAKVKGRLESVGLVSNVIRKNDLGKITGHYIKVNFFWTTPIYTRDGKTPPMDKPVPNALREEVIPNAKETNKKEEASTGDKDKGWNKEAMAAWTAHCDGVMPIWGLKTLKGLVNDLGKDVVIGAFREYLKNTDPKFASASSFASRIGLWKKNVLAVKGWNDPKRFKPH